MSLEFGADGEGMDDAPVVEGPKTQPDRANHVLTGDSPAIMGVSAVIAVIAHYEIIIGGDGHAGHGVSGWLFDIGFFKRNVVNIDNPFFDPDGVTGQADNALNPFLIRRYRGMYDYHLPPVAER